MKRSLLFALSFALVASAYCAAPQAVAEVKKEATQEVCKCDAKCTTACACPQCPKKEAALTKTKEAATTQAVAAKAEATAKS